MFNLCCSEEKDGKQAKETDISTNLCLGLLHAKLHNYHAAIECLQKATVAPRQSDEGVLFVAYLFLADMFKRRQHHETALANFDRALALIESDKSQEDPVLETEVKLARIDCHDDKAVIAELERIEESLKLYGSDTKYICLKAIVYDTLARHCLMQKEYTKFDYAVDKSILLKQSGLSHYHPSLAIDYIFKAERHIQQAELLPSDNVDSGYVRQARYREALVSYERALEVYNLNLSKNNLEVRKIYYAMGDIMCDMDKLPNAMEKYDVAEDDYSEADENDAESPEGEDLEDSVEILMARASMHRHLAEYHARKTAYQEAIVEMNKTISLYSQQLPSSTTSPSSPSGTSNLKLLVHDLQIILANLRHLAQCYAHLGDIIGTAQNEDDGYFMALNIYMKLVPYDKTLEKEEALLYKKISDYYENLHEYDEALESLQKVVQLGETSIAALYRMGRLYEMCNNPGEAVKNYRTLLAHPSIQEQEQLKQIIQEKLNVAQKLKESQNLRSKSSTPSNEEVQHSGLIDSSIRSRRGTTTSTDQQAVNDLNANSIIGG
jgi:tetratricopeptide (TPR) repeat protein